MNDVYCYGCKCRETCLEKEDPESRANCAAWLFYSDMNTLEKNMKELEENDRP